MSGTWEIVEHSWEETGIYAGGELIAVVPINSAVAEDNQDEFEAQMLERARLIAAAPDMYEALKSTLAWISHWSADIDAGLKPTDTSLRAAASEIAGAIAKATGAA